MQGKCLLHLSDLLCPGVYLSYISRDVCPGLGGQFILEVSSLGSFSLCYGHPWSRDCGFCAYQALLDTPSTSSMLCRNTAEAHGIWMNRDCVLGQILLKQPLPSSSVGNILSKGSRSCLVKQGEQREQTSQRGCMYALG